jgi:hypothetical protein
MRLRRLAAMLLIVALTATACGGAAKPDVTVGDSKTDKTLSAEVASYDLVAGRPGRFLVGVFANDNEHLLAYGATRFTFTYLGTKSEPVTEARPAMTADAVFLPIPGQHLQSKAAAGLVPSSQALGVYGAPKVTFDKAGFWKVKVVGTGGAKALTADTSFEVAGSSLLPAPGSPAPPTRQPLAGAAGVSVTAIDSRAGDGEPIPDPELHDITIADALAAHRPMMIVVATPTYCQSRFCGPITDAVAALAKAHPGPIAFVHLEIWKDFDKGVINEAAAQWIFPKGAEDAREPWVFTVGGDGIIRQRLDNVASQSELDAAVADLLKP